MIDGPKFHKALRRRLDLFEDEINKAAVEERLTDLVAYKTAEIIIDVLCGAIAESIKPSDTEKLKSFFEERGKKK